MRKEAFEVFKSRYNMRTPYDAPDNIIVDNGFTVSVVTVEHVYQRGNLRVVFEGVKVAISDAHSMEVVYPGHAEEIIKVSELALAMKRGKLGGQELEDAVELTGESIYRAATRAGSASATSKSLKQHD